MKHLDFKSQLTIPNILTLLRLLVIPYLVYLIVQDTRHGFAFLCFTAIWMTDVLDGYIARNYNQISDLGKVFDPLVDKLFQIATALAFVYIQKLPVWALVTLFIKEVLLTIGSVMLWNRKTVVSAHWYGKITTFLYVVAFSILFFLPREEKIWQHLIFVLPTLLSYYSLISYTLLHHAALQQLKPLNVKEPRSIKEISKDLLKARTASKDHKEN